MQNKYNEINEEKETFNDKIHCFKVLILLI